MKIRRTLVGLTIGVLSVMSISDIWNIHKVNAQPVNDTDLGQASCRDFVAGTYLTTISDSTGNFASRSLITLTTDGNILVADSNQGGVSGVYNPFSAAHGSWKCQKNGDIAATALNFNLSGPLPLASNPLSIAGEIYHISFNQSTHTLQGTIQLRFFDLNATVQEATGSSGVAQTFTFTGQRITAK
jgi:hypothetical protein